MAHNSPRRTWIIALTAALVVALAVGAYVVGKSVGAEPTAQPTSTVAATAPAVTKTVDPTPTTNATDPTSTTSTTDPTSTTSTTDPTSTTSTTDPTTSDAPATATSTSTSASTCNLPAGDQTVPTTTPKVDAIEPYDAAGIPVSNTYGPTQRTGEVWGCFQKSPTGAAFAATYILLSGSSAASWNAYTVGFPKRESDSEGGNSSVAVIGFKVKAYKPGDALIDLATKSEVNGQTVYLEYPTHMVWIDGMWKATTAGLSNQPSLRAMSGIEDFIPWEAAS